MDMSDVLDRSKRCVHMTFKPVGLRWLAQGCVCCLFDGVEKPMGWRQRHCREIEGRAMPHASPIEAGRTRHPLFIIESVAYAMHL